MTQEEKQLLLKDICARLPYIPIIQIEEHDWNNLHIDAYDTPFKSYYLEPFIIGEIEIKPYLRPMSNMTEEEKRELQSFYPGCFGEQWLDTEKGTIDIFECSSTITLYLDDSERIVDYLNKKMLDYRGLIPKGLALEAPEGMYN